MAVVPQGPYTVAAGCSPRFFLCPSTWGVQSTLHVCWPPRLLCLGGPFDVCGSDLLCVCLSSWEADRWSSLQLSMTHMKKPFIYQHAHTHTVVKFKSYNNQCHQLFSDAVIIFIYLFMRRGFVVLSYDVWFVLF